MFIMAIDPGDKHVGWAYGLGKTKKLRTSSIKAGEWSADEAIAKIEVGLTGVFNTGDMDRRVVVEEFRLYPDKAQAQGYSDFETAQMIGVIKYICSERGIEVIEQGAGIKKPTRAQLKGRGIQQVGKGGHACDAELHLIHYCLKNDLWPKAQRRAAA